MKGLQLISVRQKIPWWAKIGAKLVLSRLPVGYAFWQKLGLFRHGCMDAVDYPLSIFLSHVKRSGFEGKLSGKTILELGPGDSVATALIAKAYGARTVLVDTGYYASKEMDIYRRFAATLVKLGLAAPSLDGMSSIEELLDVCEARYLTGGLASLREIDDSSIDMVFSQAVLEHIRKHEFLETQIQLHRILAPAGICSHSVDLRDHLGGALNHLRFSERLWESDFFARSGFYTNRLQMQKIIALFKEAGFDVELVEVRRWQTLPTPRKKMAKMFVDLSEEELNVSGFDVLLRKKP